MKKVILTIRHKRDILGLVSQAANDRACKIRHPEFLREVDKVFRRQYSDEDVRAFLDMPNELTCGKANGWMQIVPSTRSGQYDYISNLHWDREDRTVPVLPADFVVKSKKEFDELFRKFQEIAKETSEVEDAAHKVVMSCRTTEDIRQRWPDGRRFWEAVVDRAESTAGVCDSQALVPVSSLKKLNDFCRALAETR